MILHLFFKLVNIPDYFLGTNPLLRTRLGLRGILTKALAASQ